MKHPKYISVNYDVKPLPKVTISNDCEKWTAVEDPEEALGYLEGKQDFQRYLTCYKDWLEERNAR